MTIRSIGVMLTGAAASLLAGMLVLAAAGDSYAAPQVGNGGVKPVAATVHAVQSKGDRGTLLRPPQTIKPPPRPRLRGQHGCTRWRSCQPTSGQ